MVYVIALHSYIFPVNHFSRLKTVSYEEILPGNVWVGGVKHFFGKKSISYEEIFVAQYFLRKFWLEFSQPRKF